jgi:uncharacterized membrane protein
MRLLKTVIFLCLTGYFIGCNYHNEEEYFSDSTTPCVSDNMSFELDIQPILQTNCLSCHSNSFASGGVNLEGYVNLKSFAQSGVLSKTINHENGVVAMPLNADKLIDCEIKKIDAWIGQGILNN